MTQQFQSGGDLALRIQELKKAYIAEHAEFQVGDLVTSPKTSKTFRIIAVYTSDFGVIYYRGTHIRKNGQEGVDTNIESTDLVKVCEVSA